MVLFDDSVLYLGFWLQSLILVSIVNNWNTLIASISVIFIIIVTNFIHAHDLTLHLLLKLLFNSSAAIMMTEVMPLHSLALLAASNWSIASSRGPSATDTKFQRWIFPHF